MRVYLTYFKLGGKYYSSGEYFTERKLIHEIFAEVREMANTSSLPGLIKGHSSFFTFVDVPDHPSNYPALVIPDPIRDKLVRIEATPGRKLFVCRTKEVDLDFSEAVGDASFDLEQAIEMDDLAAAEQELGVGREPREG